MKVRCVRILDEDTGDVLENCAWLSVGKEYCVLSVNIDQGMSLKFQLIGDDGQTPAYHDANQFEVISNDIPEQWIVDFVPSSHFRLAPRAWSNPSFWEDYFDRVPEAIELFETEKMKIIDAASISRNER